MIKKVSSIILSAVLVGGAPSHAEQSSAVKFVFTDLQLTSLEECMEALEKGSEVTTLGGVYGNTSFAYVAYDGYMFSFLFEPQGVSTCFKVLPALSDK